tara:strand:+ start:181 stop:753 length:573 start_codon:yes stop_codon:yes gene_type:complete
MAYGFRPVQRGGANTYNGGFIELPIDGDLYGTAIFNGDTVKYNPNTTAATAGIAVNASPLDNNDSLGILVGARWTDPTGRPTWGQYYDGNANNTDCQAYIAPLTNNIFMVQGDGAWDDKYIGYLNIPGNGSGGSTTTGNSSMNIALATSNGSNAPCVIVGVRRDGVNDVSSTTPDVYVRWIDAAIQQPLG